MVTLYNGDCLVEMTKIPDKSVDMILCDLPYGTTDCAWDSIIPFDKLWEQYKRICVPEGAIVLFGQEPFSTMLRMSNIRAYCYDWIWDKQFAANFAIAKYQPLRTHELISVFCNGGKSPLYHPIMEHRREPIKKGGNTQKEGKAIPIAQTKHAENFGKSHKIYNEKFPESQLHFSCRSDRGFHPTQKPVDLCRYLIRTYTNEGDLVLDNTMGSGTTGVACVREKRNFIGIELNEEYFKIAQERIYNEESQLTLF